MSEIVNWKECTAFWPNAASGFTWTFNVDIRSPALCSHMFSWTLIFDNPINQVKIICELWIINLLLVRLDNFHSVTFHELDFIVLSQILLFAALVSMCDTWLAAANCSVLWENRFVNYSHNYLWALNFRNFNWIISWAWYGW